MRPCHSFLRREGVLGIGHLVVVLFRRCISFCNKCKLWYRWRWQRWHKHKHVRIIPCLLDTVKQNGDDACACAYSSGLTRHEHGRRRTKRLSSALACDAAYLVVKGRILKAVKSELIERDSINSGQVNPSRWQKSFHWMVHQTYQSLSSQGQKRKKHATKTFATFHNSLSTLH